jgi:hypothetical protein
MTIATTAALIFYSVGLKVHCRGNRVKKGFSVCG